MGFFLAAVLWGYTGEHLSGQSQASDFPLNSYVIICKVDRTPSAI